MGIVPPAGLIGILMLRFGKEALSSADAHGADLFTFLLTNIYFLNLSTAYLETKYVIRKAHVQTIVVANIY